MQSNNSFAGHLSRSWIRIIIMQQAARNCCVSHETHRAVSWYEQDSGISRRYLGDEEWRFYKSPSADTIPFFKSCECATLKRIKTDVVNSGATLRYIEPRRANIALKSKSWSLSARFSFSTSCSKAFRDTQPSLLQPLIRDSRPYMWLVVVTVCCRR